MARQRPGRDLVQGVSAGLVSLVQASPLRSSRAARKPRRRISTLACPSGAGPCHSAGQTDVAAIAPVEPQASSRAMDGGVGNRMVLARERVVRGPWWDRGARSSGVAPGIGGGHDGKREEGRALQRRADRRRRPPAAARRAGGRAPGGLGHAASATAMPGRRAWVRSVVPAGSSACRRAARSKANAHPRRSGRSVRRRGPGTEPFMHPLLADCRLRHPTSAIE